MVTFAGKVQRKKFGDLVLELGKDDDALSPRDRTESTMYWWHPMLPSPDFGLYASAKEFFSDVLGDNTFRRVASPGQPLPAMELVAAVNDVMLGFKYAALPVFGHICGPDTTLYQAKPDGVPTEWLGLIYTDISDAPCSREDTNDMMLSEVSDYQDYLRGDVYTLVVHRDGKVVDCRQYYGKDSILYTPKVIESSEVVSREYFYLGKGSVPFKFEDLVDAE